MQKLEQLKVRGMNHKLLHGKDIDNGGLNLLALEYSVQMRGSPFFILKLGPRLADCQYLGWRP
jgi:hypothetical protein